MTDHQHLMDQAREAWQATAPSEQEIQRGAARVGRRLTGRTKSLGHRRILVSVGGCAAFLAALAYAGTREWIAFPGATRVTPQPTAAPKIIDTPKVIDTAKVIDTPKPPTRQAPSLAPNPDPPSAPSSLVIAPPAPESSTVARRPAAAADEGVKSPSAEKALTPSWAEVSEALSGGDENHAQSLLSDLARRGQSADDRAKAKLGLAQLEASHGNCSKARILALQVAAVQGIELKTVRRALELAAHCTQ
jgi:hypothetical protein